MRTIKLLNSLTGGLSNPSKMPGFAYNLPADKCKTGGKLRSVPRSVCSRCYACKGRYRFGNVRSALDRRYRSLMSGIEDWRSAMSELIRLKYRNKAPEFRFFRWHDSGDIQSVSHLSAIARIAQENLDIRFWLPTKETRFVVEFLRDETCPENLTIRVSNPLIGQSRFPVSGLPASAVGASVGFACPAYNQGGECRDCRECWNKETPIVNYPEH